MLYEMLTGVTPFYADDHPTMYRQVLYDDLVFDEDKAMDADTRSLLRGVRSTSVVNDGCRSKQSYLSCCRRTLRYG